MDQVRSVLLSTATMFLLLTPLAGCGNGPLEPGTGPEGISLTTTDTLYGTGDTIRAVLRNNGEAAVGYNLCLFDMERRAKGDWEQFGRHPGQACTLVLDILKPGESDTLREAVRPKMLTDVYRFRDQIQFPLDEGGAILTSNEFWVKQ